MNPTDEFILEAFKQQEILSEEMLAEIVEAYATHDDFPASSVALVDTDNDGLPNFFLTSSSEQDVLNSNLVSDSDSDNDGVEDVEDRCPTDPLAYLNTDNDAERC